MTGDPDDEPMVNHRWGQTASCPIRGLRRDEVNALRRRRRALPLSVVRPNATEMRTQVLLDLSSGERDFPDVLRVKDVVLFVLMLEDAQSPDDDPTNVTSHLDHEEMAFAEPLNKRRVIDLRRELAFGVDVEDKDAAVLEVLVRTSEHSRAKLRTPKGGDRITFAGW